jgi:putative transposase
VYLKAYEDGREARISLGEYFYFYNTTRPHQSLGYLTPAEVYTVAVENACNNMVESLVTNTVGMAGLYLNQTPILS